MRLGWVAGLCLLLFSADVAAQSNTGGRLRGVLLPFFGRGSAPSAARAIVAQVPIDNVEFPSDEAIQNVLAGLPNVDLFSAEGIAAVARELECDFVIRGSVEGRGRSTRTTLTILDAAGVELSSQVAGAPSGRTRGDVSNAARDVLHQAVDILFARRAAAEAASHREAEPAPPGPPVIAPPPPEEPEVVPELAWLTVTAGAALRTRDATVNVSDGKQRFYSSGPYIEAVAMVQGRPWAAKDTWLNGLIAEAMFGYALGLSSGLKSGGGTIDTTAMRLEADVGYLLRMQHKYQLGGVIGFGIDSFDLSANQVMPGRSYMYLRVAPRFSIDFIKDYLTAGVEAAGRMTLSVGDYATTWATSGSAFGFDAGASVGGHLPFGLAYNVSFSYLFYALSFSGAGTGGVSAKDGTDSGIVVNAQVGWAFR